MFAVEITMFKFAKWVLLFHASFYFFLNISDLSSLRIFGQTWRGHSQIYFLSQFSFKMCLECLNLKWLPDSGKCLVYSLKSSLCIFELTAYSVMLTWLLFSWSINSLLICTKAALKTVFPLLFMIIPKNQATIRILDHEQLSKWQHWHKNVHYGRRVGRAKCMILLNRKYH